MTKNDLGILLNTEDVRPGNPKGTQVLHRMREQGLSLSAIYQEIEMSTPYVNTHRDISYSYEGMSLHSHGFYEIICCRTNCGAEYLVGSHRYSLQKGDIILIRPGVSHCVILPNPLNTPYERDIIWISESFQNAIQKFLDLPPISYENELPSYLFRTEGTPWTYLCDMIHAGVLEEEQKQPYWQLNVIGNTLQLVSQFRRAFFSKTAQPLKAEEPELLDRIIAHIEQHYTERLTLPEIARLFYVSDRTVSGLFRKRLGVTFYQFLTRRRLIAAKELILMDTTLEAVAEQTGFGDYSTFYRAFKGEFGISPRDFKKLETEKAEAAPTTFFPTR